MVLQIHEILGTQPGPHLLITGGVHGDEFEPMAAIRQLMTRVNSQDLRGRLTLVPVVNVPAFQRGHRAGDDGLDLARTCPGRPDGSVTERIAHELSQLIRAADLYIDLHTGGTRLMVLPLCGYMLHPDEQVLSDQRRMARAFDLPIMWGTDPSHNGRSLSVARDANVPSIYCEYEGGGRINPVGVSRYVLGCLNVMREFGLLAGRPELSGETPLIVEDDRPGSGHMQLNHPAPADGFFDASVTLGEWVPTNTLLGTITDALGQQIAEIRARYSGLVIVLHTFPCIEKGVSVAVILETPPPTTPVARVV